MTLNEVAAEMRTKADAIPFNGSDMLKDIASGGFPAELIRHYILDGRAYQIQFSVDKLSESKTFYHLSFSREDMVLPEQNEQDVFKEAFFGSNPIILFPSVLTKHIVHMLSPKL